ncbi:MAG: protein phosphatase CheZ [Rhodospirillales bacterium]|nr:protein phosphatase CheZ [Rhodospirillales bacterium]
MDKRQRPFTSERRIAEITGSQNAISNDDLLEAFQDLSRYVREVLSRDAVALAAQPDAPAEIIAEIPVEEEIQVVEEPVADLPESSPDLTLIKQQIATLRTANADEDKLVLARDELETVVEITDKAANEIMNQSDEIQKVIDKFRQENSAGNTDNLEGHFAALEMIATNLLMACEFQDLTGQRINKVKNTIHGLEEQIGEIFQALDITEGTGDGGLNTVAADDARPDQDLLHGPQDEGEGISQADIDAMFD